MARNRITRDPDRVVATRNNARRQGANMPFQGGIAQKPVQQCPTGQEPKMVNGRMQCIPSQGEGSTASKPKIRNNGSY